MSDIVLVTKDENETLVPNIWRGTLSSIVDLIRERSFEFEIKIPQVKSLSKHEALRVAANIEAYGSELISLPQETWQTSICRWMGDSWLVLVDLFTTDEAPSDLVLFVKVFEDGPLYRFQIDSVHVP